MNHKQVFPTANGGTVHHARGSGTAKLDLLVPLNLPVGVPHGIEVCHVLANCAVSVNVDLAVSLDGKMLRIRIDGK